MLSVYRLGKRSRGDVRKMLRQAFGRPVEWHSYTGLRVQLGLVDRLRASFIEGARTFGKTFLVLGIILGFVALVSDMTLPDALLADTALSGLVGAFWGAWQLTKGHRDLDWLEVDEEDLVVNKSAVPQADRIACVRLLDWLKGQEWLKTGPQGKMKLLRKRSGWEKVADTMVIEPRKRHGGAARA